MAFGEHVASSPRHSRLALSVRTFVDLRRRTRQDLEVCGNAFWEVLRDARGEVARLVYVRVSCPSIVHPPRSKTASASRR